jgi:large subunit ribosomal protein L9
VRVVLRADVETLGHKGDLLEVSDGYARNYLVPRGLAIRATMGVVKQAEAMRRNRAARDARDREAAQDVADRLSGRRIEITARAGEGGKLFGSVTAADVTAALHAQAGVEIDRRDLRLGEPIKELGGAEVPVRLHPEVEAVVAVDVVAG